MKLMRYWAPVTTAVLLMSAGIARAQKPGEQSAQNLEKTITKVVKANYLLYLPKDYGKEAEKKWPMILFLHGSGESGSDVEKVKVHGPPKLAAAGKEFPFIIVSPQAPASRIGWQVETLNALLDDIMAKYTVDQDRVYLTGLSMGGFGTWTLAMANPERFAAIAPICGGGDAFRVRRLKDMPIWVFHGAKDPTVPIKASEDMVEALKKAGGDVKFTVYPEAGHDSWTATYDNPELYTWFLEHTRKKAEPAK
jgi:predicted peptidase